MVGLADDYERLCYEEDAMVTAVTDLLASRADFSAYLTELGQLSETLLGLPFRQLLLSRQHGSLRGFVTAALSPDRLELLGAEHTPTLVRYAPAKVRGYKTEVVAKAVEGAVETLRGILSAGVPLSVGGVDYPPETSRWSGLPCSALLEAFEKKRKASYRSDPLLMAAHTSLRNLVASHPKNEWHRTLRTRGIAP